MCPSTLLNKLLANYRLYERLYSGRSGIGEKWTITGHVAAHDGPVLGLHPMFGPDSGAWQSKLWSGVMDVSRKHTNGSGANSGLGRSAASY